jgi:hypothetical protein
MVRHIYERSCNRCASKHTSDEPDGAKRDGWASFALVNHVDLCPRCTAVIAAACEAPKEKQ